MVELCACAFRSDLHSPFRHSLLLGFIRVPDGLSDLEVAQHSISISIKAL